MKITIEGETKEIAAFVEELQKRQDATKEDETNLAALPPLLQEAYLKSGPANKVLTVDDLLSSTFD